MSKNKLLLLLALLMTAATGAWAQTNLSEVTAAYTAQDGETLTGTLSANVKISIADGATVTLDGVTINGANDEDCKWAGINCAGGATIILKGANTVKGFYEDYPGIHVPQGKTLTIKGDGSLDASSNGYGAGIGGGYEISCGNIFIEGGTIVATGGDLAAGIGGGGNGSCGIIMISDAVTKVVATKVEDRSPCSIGSGAGGSCATVEIGGKVYENGIADSPYTYPTYSVTLADGTVDAGNWSIEPKEGLSEGDQVTVKYNGRLKVKGVKATSDAAAAKPAASVTTAPTGAAVVGVGKTTALVSGGVADGGTLWYAVTTTNTKPTSTDGFSGTVPTAQDITASGYVYVWYFVKADDTHSDSEIAATAIEVPVAIIWDATNASDLYVSGTYSSYTKDGIKLSGNADNMNVSCYVFGDPTMDGIAFNAMESGGFTFTAPTGKAFTKIEMTLTTAGDWEYANLGTGWAFNWDDITEISTVTWKGSAAASTVDLLKDADFFSDTYVKCIAFYLSNAE